MPCMLTKLTCVAWSRCGYLRSHRMQILISDQRVRVCEVILHAQKWSDEINLCGARRLFLARQIIMSDEMCDPRTRQGLAASISSTTTSPPRFSRELRPLEYEIEPLPIVSREYSVSQSLLRHDQYA